MNALRHRAAEYLALRRALGFKLVDTERLLMQFITHLEQTGAARITTDVAVAWARQSVRAKPLYLRRRLGVVRGFARHLHTLDPATEVPPAGLLRCFPNRMPPHLYSADEIDALLHAVGVLFRQPLRVATYRTLIGLLVVTGMRIGEVVRLDRDHVDLDAGILTIFEAKFGKSRQVLLHPSTVAALREYADLRDRTAGTAPTVAFFVSTRGRLLVNTIDYTFAAIREAAGIQVPPGMRHPRVHDFRHSFAVATLLDWYRAGVDVQARLPVLSTWLGHINPASTYWYLQAAPQLLAQAAARLEHATGAAS
jgi:integrase/recombinase XerD